MSGGATDNGLRYARIHTQLLTSPKLLGLSAPCVLVYLASVLWSVAHLSDGTVPRTALPLIAEQARVSSRWRNRYAQQLVERGLWREIPGEQGGWVIHDYSKWQQTKEQVLADRATNAERQRRWRESRNGASHGVT